LRQAAGEILDGALSRRMGEQIGFGMSEFTHAVLMIALPGFMCGTCSASNN
jgi:hypothetical protein